MLKEEYYTDFLIIEQFFIDTYDYLEKIKILLTVHEKIKIAIGLFEHLNISSFAKKITFEFGREMLERYLLTRD